MSTITREQLRERAREKVKSLEFFITQTAFADTRAELEEELELARIALASLEAEAVGYIDAEYAEFLRSGHIESCSVYAEAGEGCITLYAAPPAPVSVPDELTREEYKRRFMEEDNFDDTFRGGWNACRAAMLQSFGNSEQLNSPVIPDGWVAVPVEPTEDMIVNGFESEPDESFSDEKEWEVYEAMSGCQQAAHRAKLCWAAMISAAPKI